MSPTAIIRGPREGLLLARWRPLVFILGPCVIESRDHARECALAIQEALPDGTPWVFKASFDKANRSSLDAFRGPGLRDGLSILAEVREELQVPVTTDLHEPWQAPPVAEVVDVLQIPAFLCRQTDLLVATAKAARQRGRVVNVKRGQFLPPPGIRHAIRKIEHGEGPDVLVTERGSSFGHGDLVMDPRSLVDMAPFAPVVFDATHSVQRIGGSEGRSGGSRFYVPALARAAVAVGVAAVFAECHPDPDSAPSDGANMLEIANLPTFVEELQAIDDTVRGHREETP